MISKQSLPQAGKMVLAVFVYALLMSSRVWATPAPGGQQATPPQAIPTAGAESAESELKALVQRYYDAVARKDIEAVEQTWHSGGPARAQRNIVVMDFELRDVTLTALTLSGVAADANGGRARVVTDLTITTIKTQKTRRERRVRDMTFLPEAGVWKIWNEASAGAQLAQRLLSVSDAERDRLIASEPELVSDDALVGLSREVARLRGEGISPRILEVLALQGRLARAVGNTAVLARSLLDAGLIHQITGNPEPAAPAFAEARDAFAEVGDAAEVAACDTNLGNVAYLLRDYQVAFAYYQKALDLDQNAALDVGIARDFGDLGGAHLALGQPDVALEEYQKSLTLREKLQDTPGVMWTLVHIGVLHARGDRHPDALTALQRSLDLAEREKDLAAICTVMALRARSLLASGDIDASLAAAARATEVATGIDLFDVIAHARVTTGRAHRQAGRADQARAAFEEAVAALANVSTEPGTETFFDDRRSPHCSRRRPSRSPLMIS